MQFLRSIRRRAGALAGLALATALPVAAQAQAQSGRVTGTVSDPSRQPVAGATISVVGTPLGALSGPDGRYVISSIPPGPRTIRVTRIGSRALTREVTVTAGAATTVDFTLEETATQLGGVVVSASRRVEKITDAPATVTRIDAAMIERTVGNSFAPILKEAKGVDFAQVGMTAVSVNARGFNSSFNNRMLMMEDGRIAVLPENGLPVGAFTTTSKIDLAGVEVLIGPGAALYGADASNGVITVQSKDPKQYPGTSVETSVGNRGFFDIQGRRAGVVGDGRFGYKVTGEYLRAFDWQNTLIYQPVNATGPVVERGIDYETNVMRGNAALVTYFDQGARLEFSGGASQSNGLGQTSVGRNQLVDWQYRHGQAKYTSDRWFAQAYVTQSLSGGTFQLNGFSQNQTRFPSLSTDSLKSLSDFPAVGRLMAAEVQNNFMIPGLTNARVVYGAQVRNDNVSSKRQWLTDRLTGENISVTQLGGYAQVEMPLVARLRLVAAARYDKHDYYDPQFSPKAALLFTPLEDQTFRVSYNRAFKSPTLLQTSFHFPSFAPAVGIFGNREGFEIRRASDNSLVRTIAPIAPEINNTYELGYKGILGGKLFVDVTGYYSNYENFLSPLIIIANPFVAGGAATRAHRPGVATPITDPNAAGALQQQIALTYVNASEATLHGTDLGFRYVMSPRVATTLNASFQKLDEIKLNPGDPVEASAFNAPTTKFTAGMDFTDLVPRSFAGFTVRYVNKYDFRSGVNVGTVPTFTTVDLSAGYNLQGLGARLTASIQNAFACTGGTTSINGFVHATRPQVYTAGQKCGFGRKHIEMINAPEIGTMMFLGLRIDR